MDEAHHLPDTTAPSSTAEPAEASSIKNKVGKEGKSAMEEMMERGVDVPESGERARFSFRQLMAFLGPGFLMSIAYLDPGNVESDLGSGASAGFSLLWVLLLAHVLGLLLQRLSARLGVVSGKHLAEMAHIYYAKVPRLILWVMVEIAIIGADMQEVIGTALAFSLLSKGLIPLWAGVLITVVDTLSFLFLDKFGFRKLEAFFCLLIAVMAFTFGTEYVLLKPDQSEVLRGVFIPQCKDCSVDVFLQAVSIIGAVIMPHNLYLHSALVKTRRVDRTRKSAISKANMYFFVESALALLCSFIINLFVMSVFGKGLAGKTNLDARQICIDSNSPNFDVFENNTDTVDVDIYKGGIYLGCAFGTAALYIWAIGILAAGQSSTMAGCYAGQFVMEGFLNMRWARWKRVLFTRSIAIVPTLFVAVFQDISQLSVMNDLLNALQMVQLPFALIPVLTFTSSKNVMRDFRTGIFFRVFLSFVGFVAICINLFFLYDFIYEKAPNNWLVFLAVALFTLVYFSYLLYLTLYCVIAMIGDQRLLNCAKKTFPMKDKFLEIEFHWLSKNESEETTTNLAATSILKPDDLQCASRELDRSTIINSADLKPATCCEECITRSRASRF